MTPNPGRERRDRLDRRRDNLRGTLRDTLLYIPGSVVPAVLSAVYVAVFTRLFDEKAFGRYSLVFSTCMLVVYLGSGWISHSILRYQPRYDVEGRRNVFVAGVLRLAAVFISLLALPPLIVGILARSWLGLWSSYICAGSVLVAGLSAYIVVKSIGQAERHSAGVSAAQIAFSVLRIGFALGLVLLVSRNAVWLIAGPAVAYLVVTPPMFVKFGLLRALRAAREADRPKLARQFAVYGLPLVGRIASERILGTSDRYVIEWFRGSADVGMYSASYNVAAMAMWLVVSPVLNASYPVLTREWEGGGRPGVPGLISSYTRYFILGAIPLVAFIAAASHDIAALILGEAFWPGHVVMPWIAGGAVLLHAGFFGDRGLYLREKVYRLLGAISVCAVANVGLNVVLVPRMGYRGAAIATLLSSGLYPAIVAYSSRRELPWHVPWRSVSRAAFAGALAWGVMNGLGGVTSHWNVLWRLALTGCVGLVAYAAVLFATKELTLREMRLLYRYGRGQRAGGPGEKHYE